jgi:hydrogenase maturation protease
MTPPRILIAGIGNIFLGDDAFGSEVARRLLARPLPDGVFVTDFGIRGFDLAYALLDGFDATILVDATPRGGAPGTLYLIEPDPGEAREPEDADLLIQTHGMDPVKVLRLAKALGGRTGRVLLVGCEPETIGTDEDPVMGLSAPVEAAVDESLRMIDALVAELLAGFTESVNVATGIPTEGSRDQTTTEGGDARCWNESPDSSFVS